MGTSLEELRRQLRTGELYEEPSEAPPDDLWEFVAGGTEEQLKRHGVTPAMMARQFAEDVKGFGKAFMEAGQAIVSFGAAAGKAAVELEQQIWEVNRAFNDGRTEDATDLAPEVVEQAKQMEQMMARKAELEAKMVESGREPTGGTCENCGAAPAYHWPSMTAYEWDGTGEDPNRAPVMCVLCAEDYNEHWSEMWNEYNAERI